MKQRVLTSLVLGPIVLVACLVPTPYPLFVLCLLAATIAFWELRILFGSPRVLPVLTLLSMALPFYAIASKTRDSAEILPWCCAFFALGVAFAWIGSRGKQPGGPTIDLAGLWITMPLMAIWIVHFLVANSTIVWWRSPLLMLVLPVWGGDIAAMLVGRRFGKRLLAPKISPGKTVEGAAAQLFASLAVALALAPLLGMNLLLAGGCGLTAGIAGQAGDLFESYVKRKRGVKDSGTVLPGHGGLLDRIDSLLFSAPFVALLIVYVFTTPKY